MSCDSLCVGRQIALVTLLAISMSSTAGHARAGSVSGTVRDAATQTPLSGIDLDLLDDQFRLESGLTAISGPDGRYTISGISGDFHVRADPSLAQGFVDQFWPGSFLPAQAQMITVGSNDAVTGIDFLLEGGTTITGIVLASDTSLPLANCDIDVIAPDGSFLSGVDAVTGPGGSYEIGLLPPGQFLVKADPTLLQGYVPEYHPGAFSFAGAVAVPVAATPVSGIDFVVEPGGEIAGRVLETGTLQPAMDVDIDLFDVLFGPLDEFDAATDEFGDYTLGIVPVGTYYVLADALFDQPWVDTFFGQSATIQLATAVTVAKGQLVGDVDIQIARQGFLAGSVTDAITSQPIAGIDLDVLDPAGGLLPQYDGATGVDGTYRIGPIPPGSYLLRADPASEDPWADQYHPGVFPISGAQPIAVGNDLVSGLDFALVRGGWIRGTVTRASNAQPLAGVDLDVLLPSGESVPSVDADTDALGGYRIGSLPPGTYVVRADPDPITGLATNYWPGAESFAGSAVVQVLVGLDTQGIDFSLTDAPATSTPLGVASALEILNPPHPNPFRSRTTIRLRAGLSMPRKMDVFDLRGRRVRQLSIPAAAPGEEILLQWNGRDDSGRPAASGLYFLRLGAGSDAQTLELLRLR